MRLDSITIGTGILLLSSITGGGFYLANAEQSHAQTTENGSKLDSLETLTREIVAMRRDEKARKDAKFEAWLELCDEGIMDSNGEKCIRARRKLQ